MKKAIKKKKKDNRPLVQKHRPRNFSNLIGQDVTVEKIENWIDRDGRPPNLLLFGPSGTGKTSTVYIIARKRFGKKTKPFLKSFNASKERGIDFVRNVLTPISKSSIPLIIHLDEADKLTEAAQEALRGVMEPELSPNVQFILTCNNKNNIKLALQSRCTLYRFGKIDNWSVGLKVKEILKKEEIKIPKGGGKALETLIKDSNGDLRSILNTIDGLINKNKEINLKNILAEREIPLVKNALEKALENKFDEAKDLIEDAYINYDYDIGRVFNKLFDSISITVKNRDVRMRLYRELAKTVGSINGFGDELIHLVGFIAYCCMVTYLPKGCPALDKS